MPTTDDLRKAMNDLAAGTDSLSPTDLLRDAKRYRARRWLLAGAGAAGKMLDPA
jgi:hypothetical protein